MNTHSPKNGQENIAAALASIIFFIPFFMGIKTPFVIKYMKIGFLINVFELTLSIVGSVLFMLSPLLGLLSAGAFIYSLYLAFQAMS
jgi:hypothetical protein